MVSFAAITKRRTLSRSLPPPPSERSVLVFESTPAGRTAAIAAATLSASSPPARMSGHARLLDDAAADCPIVRAAEPADLTVAGLVAIEQ